MTVRWDADYDPRKGVYFYQQQQRINDLVEDNLEEQINGINGWTPDRSMRKVGSISPMAFYKWYIENKIGDLDNVSKQAELMKFLNARPEFRTVDKIKHDTANQTSIIIK